MVHGEFLEYWDEAQEHPLSSRKVGIRHKDAGMEPRNTPENGDSGHRKVGTGRKSPQVSRVLGCATEHWDGAWEYWDMQQEHPWATGVLGCASDSMEWATGTLEWGTGTLGCAAGIPGWGTGTSLGFRNTGMGLRKVRTGGRNAGVHYRIIPGNVRVPFSWPLEGTPPGKTRDPWNALGWKSCPQAASILGHPPGRGGLLRVRALGIAGGVLAASLHPGVFLGRRRRHHLWLLLPGFGGW